MLRGQANFRQRSANVHDFALVPRTDIPRSSFRMQHNRKMAFSASVLNPVYCEEVLPGDTFNLSMTAFCRLATPLFPFMDNVYLDSFFFFVPNRLVWTNWQRFCGERDPDPDSSIDYTVPVIQYAEVKPTVGSIFDLFGLPVEGQVTGTPTLEVNALPFRGYNLIWNEWFRDQNLQDSVTVTRGDGPEATSAYNLLPRNKRHDYFTSCLPWPQKGDSVELPLGASAPVTIQSADAGVASPTFIVDGSSRTLGSNGAGAFEVRWSTTVTNQDLTAAWLDPGLVGFADLSSATAATINQIRQAFQVQRLLERDARGGSRYTELLRSHFGVTSPDARLQRPEYLGGGSQRLDVSAIPQTSATDATTSPQGNLAAVATVLATHGFSQSFVEHGFIIGLVNVRADLTYQQGVRKMWSRQTRYDYAWPVFAHLGEQAVLSREIYCDGGALDDEVFGYQERYAEYRYHPSEVCGLMRSQAASTIDVWHLAQDFTARPVLDATFIAENVPLDRVLAVGTEALGQELLGDFFFDVRAARCLPMYGVPGLMDHF